MDLTFNKFILLIGLIVKYIHCEHYKVHPKQWPRNTPDAKLTNDEFQQKFPDNDGSELEYDFTELKDNDPDDEIIILFVATEGNYSLNLVLADLSESVVSFGTPIRKVFEDGTYNKNFIKTDERFDSRYIYEDVKMNATVLVHKRGDYYFYDGIFGEGTNMHIIISAPAHFVKDFGSNKHFIRKVSPFERDIIVQQRTVVDEGGEVILNVFYPKLLIVVDNALYTHLNRDILACTRYITIFWNAIDMMYRQFVTPKVHLKITGIVFSDGKHSVNYIKDTIDKSDDMFMDFRRLLDNMKYYFAQQFRPAANFYNYDAVITMTSLYDRTNITGVTFRGDICTEPQNVAVVRDTGNFNGIYTAAHELGHMLNFLHDSDAHCSDVDPNDSKHTAIMSSKLKVDSNRYFWSQCSIDALKEFRSNHKARCLEKSRHE